MCSVCNRSDKVIIEPESGEIVCSSCGMVISDKIQDISNVSSIFKHPSKNRTRAGGFSTLLDRHARGLYTMIGRTDKDAAGRRLDAITSSNMARLRMWDTRTRYLTSTDRNLVLAFNRLDIRMLNQMS